MNNKIYKFDYGSKKRETFSNFFSGIYNFCWYVKISIFLPAVLFVILSFAVDNSLIAICVSLSLFIGLSIFCIIKLVDNLKLPKQIMLTDNRIVIYSHYVNSFPEFNIYINYDDINKCERNNVVITNILGFDENWHHRLFYYQNNDNMIQLDYSDNNTISFAVENPDSFINELNKRIHALNNKIDLI